MWYNVSHDHEDSEASVQVSLSGRGFRFSRDGELMVAKLSEPLNVAFSRPFDYDSASTITVSKDSADRWFVSILCEEEIEQFETVNQSVGVDLGVKDAVVLSDGRRLNPSDSFDVRKKQAKIVRLQKRLSKKTVGSNNRAKARTKLARAYAEYVDAKKDWLHKTTTALVEEFDIICIEDLNVRGMSSSARGTKEKPGKNVRAKSGLNRGIMQNNFAEFRSVLEYKTDWYGGSVIAIDRFFPSSKLHAECGAINDGLKLRDRVWTCTCGAKLDRDINAAENINAAGLAVYASGDGVRPAKKPLSASSAGGRQ